MNCWGLEKKKSKAGVGHDDFVVGYATKFSWNTNVHNQSKMFSAVGNQVYRSIWWLISLNEPF